MLYDTAFRCVHSLFAFADEATASQASLDIAGDAFIAFVEKSANVAMGSLTGMRGHIQ